MESLALVGPYWKGYAAIQYLFVFGASYCDVGYNSSCSTPSKTEPLGVPFPGKTYAGKDKPNWVGYLAREFCPSGSGDSNPLLVYDYAKGGQTVSGVRSQVNDQFCKTAGKKSSWAPWASENALFSTWIGINDCGIGYDPAESIGNLFDIQDMLYKMGSRNFLPVDVPPMLRSPGALLRGRVEITTARQDPCQTWNAILRSDARGFVNEHRDATVLIFSAWNLFTEVLDNPTAFGFNNEDVQSAFAGIWADNLHPTTRMHRVIAQRLKEFLCGLEKGKDHEEDVVQIVFNSE